VLRKQLDPLDQAPSFLGGLIPSGSWPCQARVSRSRNTRSPLLRSSSSEILSSVFYYASSRPFKHRSSFPQGRLPTACLFSSYTPLLVLRFSRAYLFRYRRFRFLRRVLSFPSALRAGLADGENRAPSFLKGEVRGTDTRGGG
jgi:hypothetical protein